MKFFSKLYLTMAVSAIFFSFTACSVAKLSDAEDAYQRGEYFEAQKIYRKIYSSLTKRDQRSQKGETAFKLGICYQRLNMNARATTAFNNALRYEYPDSSVYLLLGKSLQAEGKYSQAIEAYEKFLDFKPKSSQAIEGIKGCRSSLFNKDMLTTRYVVKNVPIFNTGRADFSPQFPGNDFDRIYFTSTSEKATGDNRSEITGMKRGDIYFSRKDENGNWIIPEPLSGELNTDADEGIVSFTPDGLTMFFTRTSKSENSDAPVEIYISKRSDAAWSSPEKFSILPDSVYMTGQPAVSANGKYLYFVSDMPGGYGGLDIWRVNIDDPLHSLHNMGPQINTPGNEMFPYSRTDSLFYFSSDGHPGLGGLDIFKARMNSTGNYWSVENLGIPVNSSGDDFGITFETGEKGYFSSNRNDVRGYDHIYSFNLPELNISISGYVVDMDGEPLPGAIIRIVGDNGFIRNDKTARDGSFKFKLDRGVRYVMKAGANDYLNKKIEFQSDETEEDAEYEVDFVLMAINKPQVIENIFYDFDKATLRPESKEALDEIVDILNENPNITIEMGSHTDRKGTEEYNIRLSERRAKSVIDYLISAGIPAERLEYKGYGKSTPKTVTKKTHELYPQFEEGTLLDEEFILTLSPEDREIADQINRRTEFRVLRIDFGLY